MQVEAARRLSGLKQVVMPLSSLAFLGEEDRQMRE